jgi:ATP-dependent Zn protease
VQRPESLFRRSISLASAALILIVVASCAGSTGDEPRLAYSELIQRAAQGDVEAVIQEGTDLSVTLRGEAAPRVVTVSEQLNVWQELCAAAGTAEAGSCAIRYEFHEPSAAGGILTLLITVLLPVLLNGGFIFYKMRQAQRQTCR